LQPVVLVEDGERLLLAKGLRRIRIARSLDISKVPAVIHPLPRGENAENFVRELRLALDLHRQDLRPSQKCDMVETLKSRFEMTHAQVAAYLGIASDSVTNWVSLKSYIAPVVSAIDAGELTMQQARVFVGMSDEGQRQLWKKHARELQQSRGGSHKRFRGLYPPESFPSFYRDPALISDRLKRKSGKRQVRARSAYTANEKRRLLTSYELREVEVRVGQKELKQLKRECMAAAPIIAAIGRDSELVSMLPEEMREELARFSEVY
jgi:ParB family chromosome partitioning protein